MNANYSGSNLYAALLIAGGNGQITIRVYAVSAIDGSNPQFDLPISEDPEPRIPVQGWLSADAAITLFQNAGLDFMTLRAAANKRGFKAVPMSGLKLNAVTTSAVARMKTRNVIGVVPGAAGVLLR